jgi:hypothetical protein
MVFVSSAPRYGFDATVSRGLSNDVTVEVYCFLLFCNLALGFIRRNVGLCPEEVKKQAYLALVRSHLEYASSVWDGIATFSWMALCKSVIRAIFLLVESGGNYSCSSNVVTVPGSLE